MNGAHDMVVATALPEHRMGQRQAAELVRNLLPSDPMFEDAVRDFFSRCGVESRASVLLEAPTRSEPEAIRQSFYARSVPEAPLGPSTEARMREYAGHALPLAQAAASGALVRAKMGSDAITQLVMVSCTGMGAPGLDVALIGELGLRPTVGRTSIGFMGCHGAINGLRVAHALAGAEPGARVLVVCVELCTLHFQYGREVGSIIANALFADGAGAVVVGGDGGGSTTRVRLLGAGSCVFADSRDDMTWRIGDHGFVMTLSRRVPGLIGAGLRPWMSEWLGGFGLRIGDVASWAVHPGGPKILDATQESLGLSPGALHHSREVLRTLGNMSSPTVLFIVERLMAQAPPVRGPVVVLAFGPGLTAEAALLHVE